jgi:AcrR family transcriptional regulator
MSERGDRTKRRLLEAAARLFAERGIDAVSVRDINAAAGQRNNTALHYHFGDRAGLLRALVEQDLARLHARQNELYEEAMADGRLDHLRTLVEIMVLPGTEFLAAGPHERAWLRIVAELQTRPATSQDDVSTAASPTTWTVGTLILEQVERGLPSDVARQRIWSTFEISSYAIANRARFEDDPKPRRTEPPLAIFVSDLLDVVCAMLTAPMSDETKAAREVEMNRAQS